MATLKLPIGIEDFKKLRTEEFYYVDKTSFITDLLNSWGQVNLFTRPRRFGKSLNMNMLKYFFSYGCDPLLFDGLSISHEKELCEKYMGKFPVISITLKGVDARNFQSAQAALCSIIGNEALQFSFLQHSESLSNEEKKSYIQLSKIDNSGQQKFVISPETLKDSLFTLSHLLFKHYGQKVILLIDEYDVPLDKAQHYGYYEQMIDLIRNLFGRVLKPNDSIQFAVLTGCLRIAKESIFTGLNNFNVFSITNVRFDEHFGFTEQEVKDMLKYYNLEDHYQKTKEWYDGYCFGNTNVYCPWDVINYVDLLRFEPNASPKAFWIHTSGNDILRTFLKKASPRTKHELESLVNGECITKKIIQELTYRELYDSNEHLFSILFTTGYLTKRGQSWDDDDILKLAIPNLEIRKIFIEQILNWFQEESRKDVTKLDAFCNSFKNGDAATAESLFTTYLKQTISIRDTSVPKAKKENFYHGILLGLFSSQDDWDIDSNAESGKGFSDILIEIEEDSIGIVIEVKYAENGNFETSCMEALTQIEEKDYAQRLLEDGMTTIFKYGIACYQKNCMVRLAPVAEK